jgi:transcriptional regulator with XRE-family HTH domain
VTDLAVGDFNGHDRFDTAALPLDNMPAGPPRLDGCVQPNDFQLATRAGMHKLGVAKLEQGLREPTWATVQALANALGVTVLDFVVEDGEAEVRPAQRGRPRKAPARAQETAEKGEATSAPLGETRSATGQGRTRKGTGK